MAHFLKPDEAPPDPYTIDNRLAPGSLASVIVPLGSSLEVALWGGSGLRVTSKNNSAVPTDRISERQVGDLRILKLYGLNAGSTLLETGGSVTLPVMVGAVAGALRDAAQEVANITLRQAVLATLADPAVSRINLTIDGFTINARSYAQVRDKISAGKVSVKHNPRLINNATGNQYAFYHSPTNVLSCGFATASAAFRQGLILHEATHIACDVANFSAMSTVTSEVLAYIAQAMFMLEKIPNAPIQADPIICSAQVLAGMIRDGKQLKPVDFRSLREAIQNSPEYSGKAATPGYNGVP